MTIRLSSGLRDDMMTNYGLGSLMFMGHIRIYTGVQPEDADLPPTGTLLARITNNGLSAPGDGGLRLAMGADPGSLVNDGNWVITGMETGAPGWWRFVSEYPDDGSHSTTYTTALRRIDGDVAECLLGLPAQITPATYLTLAKFLISLPTP